MPVVLSRPPPDLLISRLCPVSQLWPVLASASAEMCTFMPAIPGGQWTPLPRCWSLMAAQSRLLLPASFRLRPVRINIWWGEWCQAAGPGHPQPAAWSHPGTGHQARERRRGGVLKSVLIGNPITVFVFYSSCVWIRECRRRGGGGCVRAGSQLARLRRGRTEAAH